MSRHAIVRHVCCWVILVLLVTVLYLPTLQWMRSRYAAEDTYYSHGLVIPLVSALLIWRKRGKLREIPKEGSRWGLVLILGAVALHLFSMRIYVFSTSAFSVPPLVFGITLFLYGTRTTRALLFPLLFLVFMFPLPLYAIGRLSDGLALRMASVAAGVVQLFGLPVYRSEISIETARGALSVADACSGLGSLIVFPVLGSLIAYLSTLSNPRKVAVVLGSAALALLLNVVRILSLVVVSHYYGSEAASVGSCVHDAAGYSVYLVGGLLLAGFAKVLEWRT